MKLVTSVLTISALFFAGSEAGKRKDKDCKRDRKCRKDSPAAFFGVSSSSSTSTSSSTSDSSRDGLRVLPAVEPLDTGMDRNEIKTAKHLKKIFLDEVDKSLGVKFDFLIEYLRGLTEVTDLDAKVDEFGNECMGAVGRRVQALKAKLHDVYCSKKEARKLRDSDRAKESFRRELTSVTNAE